MVKSTRTYIWIVNSKVSSYTLRNFVIIKSELSWKLKSTIFLFLLLQIFTCSVFWYWETVTKRYVSNLKLFPSLITLEVYFVLWIITVKLLPTTIPIGLQFMHRQVGKSIIHVNINSHTNDSTFVVTWACFSWDAHVLILKSVYHEEACVFFLSQKKKVIKIFKDVSNNM